VATNPKTGSDEFGELLRRGRERLGMSRRDLVEATRLSYPYVSQLETGYRQPSPAAIQKLADALQLSLDELFTAMGRGVRDDTAPADMPDARAVDPTMPRSQDISSRWVRNASFAGAAAGRQRATGPEGPGGTPNAAGQVARAAPARLSASSGAEPQGARLQQRPPAPQALELNRTAGEQDGLDGADDHDLVVDEAIGLLASLPPAARVTALARLQAHIVQSVIDDGVRDALKD